MKFLLNYSGNQVTLEGSPTSFNDWIFVKINSTSARNNELFINGSSVATSTTTNATADETKDRYTLLFGNNSTSDYWRGVIWQINFTKSTVTIAYN